MQPSERDEEHDGDVERRVPIGDSAAGEDDSDAPSGLPPGEHDDDPGAQETG